MNSLGRIRYVEYFPGISPELVAKGLYGYDSEVYSYDYQVYNIYNQTLVKDCNDLMVVYPNSIKDLLRKYYGNILDVFDLTLERRNEERIIPCVQQFDKAIKFDLFPELFSCLNSYREANNTISDESKSKIIKFLKNSEKRKRYMIEVQENTFECENTENSSEIKTQNSLDNVEQGLWSLIRGKHNVCTIKVKVKYDFRDCENTRQFEIFNNQLDKSLKYSGIKKFVSMKVGVDG
ncbi:hypothetical protein BB560_002197 [Smittium megazygosporum]|uniref:Uncharacterized protein n=1 Tax=Smittium megazygosporum TaxID=133381 RepID=A0A2T9ZFH8_9FUNG|nr:hypothetical protein BB560_002199 [Smittium megazygosporum]PVV03336.1 hypothetical protein BB560_002197 [Smittium megazygosporum]